MKKIQNISKINNEIYPLRPWNITGYYDGEGCFNISIYSNKKMKLGYSVTFSAEIKQHSNSINLLNSIKAYFKGKGSISFSNKSQSVSRYKISNLKDIINLVIPHFDKYPLVTSKHLNYLDFKKVILLIESGEHLKEEGLKKIKEIVSQMNTKRTFLDKWNYSKDQSKKIELVPEWIQSFADGEGNFNFHIRPTGNSNVCAFAIYQNVHDYHIMALLVKYFGGGKLYPLSVDGSFESAFDYYKERNKKGLNSVITFEVNTRSMNKSQIIPFFNKYPLYTTKALDFEDWKSLIEYSDLKIYESEEGRQKMLQISKGMNSRRKFFKEEIEEIEVEKDFPVS
uniref:Homing endonuclease LAGLIDADG domain-containing protein n=1 Tax=Armillaria gallica TaxID=47427 RepID=A0A4D6FHF8_ARMGA|nr:hypothetical protein [Armillaria gallica]